ncbi:MAG: oligosaccharide flippase family protein [Gracilimonas sp.]|nr:oligosaccharide flippase family protein [Gracilimonas sp.]
MANSDPDIKISVQQIIPLFFDLNVFKQIFSVKQIHQDIITLIGGTGLAQVIPIAISPILTRIYTPEDFGLLALFLSITSIIGVAATGRYDVAILLPDTHKKANNIAILSILIASVVSVLVFFIFYFLGDQLITWLRITEISVLIYLLPLGIILIAFSATFIALLNRLKKYREIAIAKISRSTGTAIGQLSWGFTGFTIYGLILGKLLGDLFYTIYGIWIARKNNMLQKAGYDFRILKEQAFEHRNFPKINSLHAITNTSSTNMPNILLATLFTPAIAGLYNLSYRICFAPVQLISSSVQQVFSRSVTERSNKKKVFMLSQKKYFYNYSYSASFLFLYLFLQHHGYLKLYLAPNG